MLVDLAGFTRAVAGFDADRIAQLLSAFYVRASEVIPRHGGRIVKFMGDGCLTCFEPEDAVRAIDAAIELGGAAVQVGRDFGTKLELGANVHMSTVVEGELAPGHYDVTGTGVIHTFRMASGAGIRVSEPVYRQVPNDRRRAWKKHQPPAVYTLSR
jgi:class 3 adenylate cyclase